MNRTKIIATITATIVLIVVAVLLIQPFNNTQPVTSTKSQIESATFDSVVNFRDLSTYELANGRRITKNKLLRSGSLDNLTNADMTTLVDNYELKQIVDLRMTREVSKQPDMTIPETVYHHIDVYENGTEILPNVEVMKETEATGGPRVDIVNQLRKIYNRITLHPDSQKAMRQFFEVLLTNESGSVLWHCTSGKDRTGLASAILLHILGASTETIYQDYMKTNDSRKEANETRIAQLREEGASNELIEDLNEILTVREEYLDYTFELIKEQYGNLDNYIETALQISKADQQKLRDMYLQ